MEIERKRENIQKHKGADHLLIKEGGKFSYVLIPPYLSSQNDEPNLCFANHTDSKWDPRIQQCCLREDGHVHAHVHHGEFIEDILLEQCMDEAGCALPLLWDLSSSCTGTEHYNNNNNLDDKHKKDNHVHQEGCGHEQITHGDHFDWLVPMSDGSYLLSHDDGASQHGRLVKVGQSQGRLRRQSKNFFDLFKYEGPNEAGSRDWGTAAALVQCLRDNSFIGCQQAKCSNCHLQETKLDNVELLSEPMVNVDINSDVHPVALQRTLIDVLGICCPAEIPLIKKILEPIPGVKEVSVNVASRVVTVHHDSIAVSPSKLVNALNKAQLEASIHVRGEWKMSNKWPTPYTVASGVLVLISLFHYAFGPLKWVALGAVAVGLPPIIRKAFISLKRFVMDINILMLIAVAGSVGLGDYIEAGFIIFLFTLADWLESRSMDKARMALSSVAKMAPQYAVLADSGLSIPVAEVMIGTTLSVKAGESIPIDGIVISGRTSVDESSLTGESYPVEKEVGASVWAGTINISGYVCIETCALAEDSAVARMIRLVEDAQSQRSYMDQIVETFAKYYTPAAVAAAFMIAIIPVAMHSQDVRHWLYLAIVLLVVACPCALVISTPVATTCAIAQAARSGLVVKGGKYLEVLGKVKVIAMDKTGTLTEGSFQVVEMQILHNDLDLMKLLHWIACVENKATHPIAAALVDYAKSHGADPNGEVSDFRNLIGEGVTGIIDGHEIFIGNDRLADRLGWIDDETLESSYLEEWKNQGLTICWVGVDGELKLILCAGDQLREEAAEAVKNLKDLGLHIAMLTGDTLTTATVMGTQLGQIDIHAHLLPEGKVEIIKQLKKIGPTGMVGDGINDAPALAAADVSIAMGVAGTAIAMETADIALMKNDLRKLAYAVKLGQNARWKIFQNIFISFSTKIVVVVLSLVGYASLWGAVVADVGTCLIVIFNSMRLLKDNKDEFCWGFMHRHCQNTRQCHDRKRGVNRCTKRDGCCAVSECNIDTRVSNEDHLNFCCENSDKNHQCGIRRRLNHKDTCARDCQGVDCSSVVITLSEDADSIPSAQVLNHATPCPKETGFRAGSTSKLLQNVCCQQQAVKDSEFQKSTKKCVKDCTKINCCAVAECKASALVSSHDHLNSCCENIDNSHQRGIRRRMNYKDTCGKNCRGVDCSSVVLPMSEESDNFTCAQVLDRANPCLKETGFLEESSSKLHQNPCRQQQMVKEDECQKHIKKKVQTCSKKDSCCAAGECKPSILVSNLDKNDYGCENSNKNHQFGIRWQRMYKDTCGEDCQGVDCSPVVNTTSEEPDSFTTAHVIGNASPCSKESKFHTGGSSKLQQNYCCQQQVECQKNIKKSVRMCSKIDSCMMAQCKINNLVSNEDHLDSCCENRDKNHQSGIRHQTSHEDAYAKNCQVVDCSSVVITMSEEHDPLTSAQVCDHVTKCSRKTGFLVASSDKSHQNPCCQQEADEGRNMSKFCESHQYQQSTYVCLGGRSDRCHEKQRVSASTNQPFLDVDGTRRTSEDDRGSKDGCCNGKRACSFDMNESCCIGGFSPCEGCVDGIQSDKQE
ncbi:hypothetical protein KP509_19G029500 [Ceratopteris richardii]|uniref:HMA domain-containing protein n=1 Tax=Ceratopteris richardii TaxID=49495 RepID=A0A8T2SL14_CERRI|nr:hypothetical protein KP509_19G029500 [Ceratopteris richardii]